MSFSAFAWLGAVRDSTLSASAKSLCLILVSRADKHTAECYAGMERLAREAGLSVRQGRKSVRELEVAGWLNVFQRSHATSVYRLTFGRDGRPSSFAGGAATAHEPTGDCNGAARLAWLRGIRDAELGAYHRAVCLVLLSRASEQTGDCYPSMDQIAREGGLSERKARQCVHELEQAGWIDLAQSRGRRRNAYVLSFANVLAANGDTSDSAHAATDGAQPGTEQGSGEAYAEIAIAPASFVACWQPGIECEGNPAPAASCRGVIATNPARVDTNTDRWCRVGRQPGVRCRPTRHTVPSNPAYGAASDSNPAYGAAQPGTERLEPGIERPLNPARAAELLANPAQNVTQPGTERPANPAYGAAYLSMELSMELCEGADKPLPEPAPERPPTELGSDEAEAAPNLANGEPSSSEQKPKLVLAQSVGRERGSARKPKRSRSRKRESELPTSWQPNAAHRELATELGVQLEGRGGELEKFRLHAEEHARVAANWDPAFTRWLFTAKRFADHDARAGPPLRRAVRQPNAFETDEEFWEFMGVASE